MVNYDDLGRERLRQQFPTLANTNILDPTTGTKAVTKYETKPGHSYRLVTTPFLAPTSSQACPDQTSPTCEHTMGWNVTTYDQNGRSIRAENFLGSGVPGCGGSANCSGTSTGFATTSYQYDATLQRPTVLRIDESLVMSAQRPGRF